MTTATFVEQLQSKIGLEFYRIERFPVERGKIREFAIAIQEDNPVFYEGAEEVPAPLTFLQSIMFYTYKYSPIATLGLDLRYVLHGSQEFEYFEHVKAGDELTAVCRLSDVYVKQGSRGGEMIFVEISTDFCKPDGSAAVVMKQVIVQTSGVVTKE